MTPMKSYQVSGIPLCSQRWPIDRSLSSRERRDSGDPSPHMGKKNEDAGDAEGQKQGAFCAETALRKTSSRLGIPD